MLRVGLGETGESGSVGESTTVAFSNGLRLPGGVSSSATKSLSSSTTPSLIRCAWIGLASVTVILRTTVSGTTEALILAASASAEVSSCNRSITR